MAEPILRVQHLYTRMAGNSIHEDLAMTVNAGEIYGIVGGSGSGKTVLLTTILNLLPLYRGEIKIFGHDHREVSRRTDLQKGWGVLFQHGALFSSLSVLENVCVPIIEQGHLDKITAQRIARYKLEMVGLPSNAFDKMPKELSGGMIKRTALARALALDARLVFLDEPTSGLDPISADAFDQMLKELQTNLGLCVVMITHDLGSLAMCDRIGVIIDKKMREGTVAEIRQDPHPWIQEYFHGKRAQALFKDV